MNKRKTFKKKQKTTTTNKKKTKKKPKKKTKNKNKNKKNYNSYYVTGKLVSYVKRCCQKCPYLIFDKNAPNDLSRAITL